MALLRRLAAETGSFGNLGFLVSSLVAVTTSLRLGFEREERAEHQGCTYPQNKNGKGDLPPQ